MLTQAFSWSLLIIAAAGLMQLEKLSVQQARFLKRAFSKHTRQATSFQQGSSKERYTAPPFILTLKALEPLPYE